MALTMRPLWPGFFGLGVRGLRSRRIVWRFFCNMVWFSFLYIVVHLRLILSEKIPVCSPWGLSDSPRPTG